MRYNWEKLNRQQLGTFSEYFVKMEFLMYGFQVYPTEVDDRGIDFITRYENGQFLIIQAKSITEKTDYVYMQKKKFELASNLYLSLIIFNEGVEPKLYLIPSEDWKNPNDLLVGYDYENKKSEPEWGLRLSKKNLHLLNKYEFSKIANKLMKI